MTWLITFALPNIQLKKPIETEFIALVPFNDKRVREARAQHPVVRKFLSRFSDAVGQRVRPSVVLHKLGAPPSAASVESMGGFLDLLALSTVPLARAQRLTQKIHSARFLYSNAFDPYAWSVTNDYANILLISPASLHLNEIDKFRGHTHPELPTYQLGESDIDEPLLAKLLDEWTIRFSTSTPPWRSVALFRSLNMAAQAARTPRNSAGVSLYDVGRLMILWASAFEILVHPGTANADKSLGRIYDLIETVEWGTRFAKRRIYNIYGSPQKKRVAASWLYSLVHRLRNDFTHGNPVSSNKFVFDGGNAPMWMHAAPLYRLMLTAFLPLKFTKPLPPLSKPKLFAAAASERYYFNKTQNLMEEAVRSAKPRSVSRGQKLKVYDRTPHQRIMRAGRN